MLNSFPQRLTVTLLAVCLSSSVFAQQNSANSPADGSALAADVKRIFRTRCLECHGDTRREADIHILERSSFVGEDAAVVPGSVDGSVLYDFIASDDEDYRMPEAPRPALSKGEIETVRKWIEAGAPEFPRDVAQPESIGADQSLTNNTGAEYVLTQILKHIDTVPRDDRPFIRYFSSNHLLTSGVTSEELKENRQALAKAINHLSWQPDIVVPKVVDEKTETIFAVDIRRLGWQESVFKSADSSHSDFAAGVDLFDLVLLEYPYGLAFEHSETFTQLFERYMEPAGLIRPVPFVRIDWFISVALQSPLYEDLLQLPHELAELEEEIGVDSAENIRNFVARRAGMTLSGVSRNNRVVERHPARYGAYWKSFDFQTSKGQQNMFADPLEFHFAGGEMIWNLPNGLQAYLVTDNAGHRILEAPTAIVTDKFAEDRVVRNGMACMRCHERGMKRFADNVRPAFEAVTGSTGLDKQQILRLYATRDEMNDLLDKDQKRFMDAMEEALGEPQQAEPIVPTSRKFLDAPLTMTQAAAELGLKDSSGLQSVFRLPQFTQLGLAGLSAGGVIRRDTWEDYFDRVARQLGTGVPVAPVDGLTRPDQLADSTLAATLTLSTNKRSNVFSPGEEMVIHVANNTDQDMFFELIGTSARGKIAPLTNGVRMLKKGESFRFPETGSITIQPQLGTEFITVFANPESFEPGILVRGENTADRFVHGFYGFNADTATVSSDPTRLIKKTLRIETR
ncbi:MAG: hypothetical protein KDA81_14335 [Planctomycetaceae bacterium]|nr:hypothetical protein [Planctomycetaceae bacterium]